MEQVAAFITIRDQQPCPENTSSCGGGASISDDEEPMSSVVQSAKVGCCSIPQTVQTLLEELERLPLFAVRAQDH